MKWKRESCRVIPLQNEHVAIAPVQQVTSVSFVCDTIRSESLYNVRYSNNRIGLNVDGSSRIILLPPGRYSMEEFDIVIQSVFMKYGIQAMISETKQRYVFVADFPFQLNFDFTIADMHGSILGFEGNSRNVAYHESGKYLLKSTSNIFLEVPRYIRVKVQNQSKSSCTMIEEVILPGKTRIMEKESVLPFKVDVSSLYITTEDEFGGSLDGCKVGWFLTLKFKYDIDIVREALD